MGINIPANSSLGSFSSQFFSYFFFLFCKDEFDRVRGNSPRYKYGDS